MCRLLLLEDDRGLIDGLKYSLEKNGFDLDVARSVREAEQAFSSALPGWACAFCSGRGRSVIFEEERRRMNMPRIS